MLESVRSKQCRSNTSKVCKTRLMVTPRCRNQANQNKKLRHQRKPEQHSTESSLCGAKEMLRNHSRHRSANKTNPDMLNSQELKGINQTTSSKFTRWHHQKVSVLNRWVDLQESETQHKMSNIQKHSICCVLYLLLTPGTCQKTTELPPHGLFVLSAVLPHKSSLEPER